MSLARRPWIRRFLPRGVAAVIMTLAYQPASADMIDTSGLDPWEVCALCHSLDGISRMAKFPKLAGQRAAYIEKQFLDFHTGTRRNDGGQMVAITTEIDLDELPAVAAYFSALPAPPAVMPEDEVDTTTGKTLFREGRNNVPACISCHGKSDPALPLAPWLEAQHADYLAKQLVDFRDGGRGNDPDGVMQSVAGHLSDEDIESLAVFIAAQDRPERAE